MRCKPLGIRRVSYFLLAMMLVWAASSPAFAETSDDQTDTEIARGRLFQELAAEVAAFEQRGNVLKKVVKLVKPTVVHIEAKKVNEPVSKYGVRKPREEAGSGVIVSLKNEYYVLTNRHVIRHAPLQSIKLALADGRELRPIGKWEDEGTDVAVMAIAAKDLTPARFGNSDNVEIGDFVLAVGSPFGLSHSVTYGIISAKGRRDLKLGREGVRYQDFFQTDAAINPGNSGGPLLNLRGEVIAINTAIASSSGGNEGIGFAIPINMFMAIARQLIEDGHVVRSFLGVHLDSQFDPAKAAELGLTRRIGARVTGITPKSPAERARLQVNDVILKVNDAHIEDDSHLVNYVSLIPLGDDITLLVWRDGKQITVKAKVGNRADYETQP
jgi:serine protease Do